jgi:hypothetical protein
MAGSRPAITRCCSVDRAPHHSVAVGTSRGARAVVLKRVRPAGPRTSGRRNGLDDGERERESQGNPGQHGHSPRVEARSGFCGLDPGTRRLFPCSHSNGVRPVQVFVCSLRCAVHVTVICLCNRTSGQIQLATFHIFDLSSARQDHGEHCAHAIALCMAIDVFREARLQQIGSSPSIRDSAGIDRCHPSSMLLVRLPRAMLAPLARLCSVSTSITAL